MLFIPSFMVCLWICVCVCVYGLGQPSHTYPRKRRSVGHALLPCGTINRVSCLRNKLYHPYCPYEPYCPYFPYDPYCLYCLYCPYDPYDPYDHMTHIAALPLSSKPFPSFRNFFLRLSLITSCTWSNLFFLRLKWSNLFFLRSTPALACIRLLPVCYTYLAHETHKLHSFLFSPTKQGAFESTASGIYDFRGQITLCLFGHCVSKRASRQHLLLVSWCCANHA